jgi:hypothetical protein
MILMVVAATAVAAFVCWNLWPFGADADSTPPDERFKSAVAVRVYDIHGHNSYSEADIAAETIFADMDAGGFTSYVSSAEYRKGQPRWKGSSLAVLTLADGTTQHVAVSYYGGFFKVVGQSGYWERPQWTPEDDPFTSIIQEQFIPAPSRVGGGEAKTA